MIKSFFSVGLMSMLLLCQSAFAMEGEIFFLDCPSQRTSTSRHLPARPADIPDVITLEELQTVPYLAGYTAPVGSGPCESGWQEITLAGRKFQAQASISRTPEFPNMDHVVKIIVKNKALRWYPDNSGLTSALYTETQRQTHYLRCTYIPLT